MTQLELMMQQQHERSMQQQQARDAQQLERQRARSSSRPDPNLRLFLVAGVAALWFLSRR